MLLRAISPLFHIILYIFLTSGVKLHICKNVVVRFIVFLTSATLICRSTDISECFKESLGIRDNDSRLYLVVMTLNSPWKIVLDQSMTFYKVLTKQWQTLRLSTKM